jgi:hypothetical protein
MVKRDMTKEAEQTIKMGGTGRERCEPVICYGRRRGPTKGAGATTNGSNAGTTD